MRVVSWLPAGGGVSSYGWHLASPHFVHSFPALLFLYVLPDQPGLSSLALEYFTHLGSVSNTILYMSAAACM